jgi:hypothetical protein
LTASPLFASLESVVLTVGRARPVAVATSAAVSAPSLESAPSTFARVSPGFVRIDAADPFARLAARVRVRAGVGFVEVAFRGGRFAAGLDLAGLGSEAGRSRGSSAASARRSLSASASSWSRRFWMSWRMRSINLVSLRVLVAGAENGTE